MATTGKNGNAWKGWVVGVVAVLVTVGIGGLVVNYGNDQAQGAEIQRNKEGMRELKEDLTRRLDRIEGTQDEILRELRK